MSLVAPWRNQNPPVLYQSAYRERAGHRPKCPLFDEISLVQVRMKSKSFTASSGKAVEANHQRLGQRISIFQSDWPRGRVNLGLRKVCSSCLSNSSSSASLSCSTSLKVFLIGSSRPGSFILDLRWGLGMNNESWKKSDSA